MLCGKCYALFNGQSRRNAESTATYTLYDHHVKLSHLEDQTPQSCSVCQILNEKLETLKAVGLDRLYYGKKARLVASIRPSAALDLTRKLFHLEFQIEIKDHIKPRRRLASFVLVQAGKARPSFPRHPYLLTSPDDSARSQMKPISGSTADTKVFDLAKEWIRECVQDHPACSSRRAAVGQFYPSRLIDVWPFGRDSGADDIVRLNSSHVTERKADQGEFTGDYVTLSHCWGKEKLVRLERDKLKSFQKQMIVSDLPLTFQHTIAMARHLDIRWLWIDALCIVQDDMEDWFVQSAQMREIYASAYCNISATASKDSTEGLFRPRDMEADWFTEAILRMPEMTDPISCLVLDLSFWDKYVQDAPVNRRSWVLQERLLSRRVLHMCQDQIAFECRTLDRAECRPQGLPHFYMSRGRLVNSLNMKKMDQETGRQLRRLRISMESGGYSKAGKLQAMVNEPADDRARWEYYENWKRIVEAYTKMELTLDKDRLIALSGIARRVREQIVKHGIKDEEYIAGLWKGGLSGQLLWYVNPIAGDKQPMVDLRPKDSSGNSIYRAPSFSWASIETKRGVTYGELTYDIPYNPLRATITDEDLEKDAIYIKIKIVRLAFMRKEDNFGIITDGYIVLKGVLRRVLLVNKQQRQPTFQLPNGLNVPIFSPATDGKSSNAFAWRLIREGKPALRENSIVWLDSPMSEPSPFGPDGNVYVIPVLRRSGALICLLVQLEAQGDYGPRYRRIGLTKVLDLHMEAIKDILTPPGNRVRSDAKYYWGGEDQPTGENTICII